MVGIALQVIGLLLVAVGLWVVHPAAFLLLGGAGLVALPHVIADDPVEEPVEETVR